MIKTIAKVAIGLLAGAGVLALGSKLINKYYASLAEEDAEFDMDEYEDEDETVEDTEPAAAEEDKANTIDLSASADKSSAEEEKE